MTNPSAFRYHCRVPVRWKDLDSVGVLNNAVYLTFLEQTRFEYCRELDLLEDGQFNFVLGETWIRYEKPVREVGEVEVAARVCRLGVRSFAMEYELSSGGTRVARASATLVCVGDDLSSRPLPEAFRRRVAEFEGIAAGESE